LAYSIYADYNSFDDTGQFDVYAGVNLDNIDQALTSIMEELERIRHEAVDEAELTKVKNKMSGGLQMALENTFAIADRIGTRLLLTGQVKTPEETLADLAAVTVEDVQRVAAEMLDPSRLRMAAIVPEPGNISARFAQLTRKSHATS
jgi:predicted Zn-dependent peptidase